MKVAALTARTTHCLTNSFQTNQLGTLPVSALQLHVPPSIKSQPQATPVDDGSFLLVLCFPGMGGLDFSFLFGCFLSIWWCYSIPLLQCHTEAFCSHWFSFMQRLLHLSTTRQPSTSGSPCPKDTGVCGSVILAYCFVCVHPGTHMHTCMWGPGALL